MNYIRTLLLCLSVFAFRAGLGAAELVKDGAPLAVLRLPPDAPPPVAFAAREIASYIRKITGASLSVSAAPDSQKYTISFAVQPGAAPGPEGYHIAGTPDGVRISGGSPQAVLYGAYAFLEEFFGIRWFAPGELYEHCPRKTTLSVPDRIDRKASPLFAERLVPLVNGNWNSDLQETWLYLVRNRWQIRSDHRLRSPRYCRGFAEDHDHLAVRYAGGGHCLASLIPDRLFETHPEYFALVNGQRIRQTDDTGKHIAQPCTSHPEVIQLAVQGVTEYFRNAPPGSSYLLGGNDVQLWCQCENCTRLDPPAEKEKGVVSTRFYTFIRQVAQGVHREFPEAEIQGWGYQNYRFAPGRQALDGVRRIHLCDHQRCYRHSMGDETCTQNALFRDMFAGWRKAGMAVSERGYQETLLKSGYFYLPIEYILAEDLRYFRKIGVDGYLFVTSAPDAVYRKSMDPQLAETRRHAMYCLWPSLYICGKMLWNTSLEPEDIWEDAGKHFYGTAWPVMKEFRTLLRKAFTQTPGHIIYNHPPEDVGRSLQSPALEKKLLSLLRQAERIAARDPDPKVAERLAQETRYFQETWVRNAQTFREKQAARRRAPIRNGHFAEVIPTPPGKKKILSATFPAHWSFAGKNAVWREKDLLLNGVIYQFLQVTGGETGGVLSLEVRAQAAPGGKGSLRSYLSLCVRRPGETAKFRHDIKRSGGHYSLTSTGEVYRFTCKLAPFETGYLYIGGRNAVIQSITGTYQESPK